MAERSPETSAQNLRQALHQLQTRWDNIMSRASDRRNKLTDALAQAESFHTNLQDLIAWLTDTEKNLNNLKPVSRVLDTVRHQIENHKVQLLRG